MTIWRTIRHQRASEGYRLCADLASIFPILQALAAVFTVNVTVITIIPPTCCCGCETLGLGRFGSPETIGFARRLSELPELPLRLVSHISQFGYRAPFVGLLVCLVPRLSSYVMP